MTIDRQILVEKFRSLADEEIIGSLRKAELTEEAQIAAWDELRSRGIVLPDAPQIKSIESKEEAPGSDDFVLLARFLDPIPAQILHSLLRSEGIPATLADANTVQTNMLWSIALGGVRVLVPRSYLEAAKKHLAALDRGDYALDEQNDVQTSFPDGVASSRSSDIASTSEDVRSVVLEELKKGSRHRLLLARFFAFGLDSLFFFLLPAALLAMNLVSEKVYVVSLGIGFLLFLPLFEWRYGASPGKIFIGLRLLTARAKRPGYLEVLVRRMLLIFEMGLIGPILILATPRAQRLGDIVTGIYVIQITQIEGLKEAIKHMEVSSAVGPSA